MVDGQGRKQSWWDGLLVLGLILFDLAIHPLGAGPDRLIHDPAVYRLINPNYLPTDWYTNMATSSGVYSWYAKLINFHTFLHLPEELWRQIVYLICLGILYYALIKIARLFTQSWLVVPIIFVLHFFLVTGSNQPVWLYGPFLQIDGGLAPRSVGVALSFVGLYFLIRGGVIWPALFLGLATLIHVSNSLIVFSLFFLVWLIQRGLVNRSEATKQVGAPISGTPGPIKQQPVLSPKELFKQAGWAIVVYLLAGGWFALVAARHGSSVSVDGFTTAKFIWTWIYYRAPYLALPLAGRYWWLRLGCHIVAVIVGWLILRRGANPTDQDRLNILGLVGLGAVGYFFVYYFFAFVQPWLPGFQFYSIRIIYLTYFVAYLFIALIGLKWLRLIVARLAPSVNNRRWLQNLIIIIPTVVIAFYLLATSLGRNFVSQLTKNLRASAWAGLDASVTGRRYVPFNQQDRPPTSDIFRYLASHGQPFLAPPNVSFSHYYLPSVASFKSFGFTARGLPEWYSRINDVASGQLDQAYLAQAGQAAPVYINWKETYPKLTAEQVMDLGQKYNFKLFVTYRSAVYPFQLITVDDDYSLYQLPN